MNTPHEIRYVDGKPQRRVRGGNWQQLEIVSLQPPPVESLRGTRATHPTTEWKWTDL